MFYHNFTCLLDNLFKPPPFTPWNCMVAVSVAVDSAPRCKACSDLKKWRDSKGLKVMDNQYQHGKLGEWGTNIVTI